MTFELYLSCLVVDKDKDVVDAVEDGPGVVLFVGPSKVLLAIPEGQFKVYTCPLGWEDMVLWFQDHLDLLV